MSRGGTRIYLGRLPRDVREKDLERFVRGYGRIREISIKVGYGFVEFDDSRDAEDAVYDLNGKDLLGERIVVEHARNPERRVDFGYRSFSTSSRSRRGRTPPVRTEHRLAVENLSSRANWQDLKEYMMKAGDVTFADAHKRKKGEGVVEFGSRDDMKNALKKLDDTEFFGRRIVLKVEKVRRRTRSRSRSRSHSHRRRTRSHSHSRSRSRSPKRRRTSRKSRSPRRSHSPRKSRSKSKSKSLSKSPSPAKETKERKSKSRSPSVDAEADKSKSVSPSPQREEEEGSPERRESPVENGDEENGEAEADEVVDEMEDNDEDDE